MVAVSSLTKNSNSAEKTNKHGGDCGGVDGVGDKGASTDTGAGAEGDVVEQETARVRTANCDRAGEEGSERSRKRHRERVGTFP